MSTKKNPSDLHPPQLAVFDIDGTIIPRGAKSPPPEVRKGIAHLRKYDVITTISTGRPYVRVREKLGECFDEVVSDDALISVEHGAKIVKKNGEVVVESQFNKADIDKLIEFTGLNVDMVQFLAFNPPDLKDKSQIWCPEPSDVELTRKQRGWYAEVFSGSLIEVKERLLATTVSNVTLKLKDFIHVENLSLNFTGGSIKTIFQDGYIEYIKREVTKARAIDYMCKYFGIYERNLLVAGNAINDVDMLNMEARYRVLVGPDGPERNTVLGYVYGHELLTFVNAPKDLGNFLQSL